MNIYILNTLQAGIDTIELIYRDISIAGVIGLSDRNESDNISGFVYQKDFCEKRGLHFIEVESYTLKRNTEKAKLLDLEIDVLIVSGWQRLIPKWLIEHCRIGALGGHGSHLGITQGRGRSPQNWALLLGHHRFSISIFNITVGVDSGNLVASRWFEYSKHDDIASSQRKVCFLIADMLIEILSDPNFAERKFEKQDESQARYLPQRTAEDGCIDWNRTSADIYNFIRALSKPFPGAETSIGNTRIKIWKSIPFELDIQRTETPGTITHVFQDQVLVIETKDAWLCVTEWEYVDEHHFAIRNKMICTSVSFQEQMKNIMVRHQEKYPDRPLATELEVFLKD